MPFQNVRLKGEASARCLLNSPCVMRFPLVSKLRSPVNYVASTGLISAGTLSDLLNHFVAEHDEYTWKIEDGIVRIFLGSKGNSPLDAFSRSVFDF